MTSYALHQRIDSIVGADSFRQVTDIPPPFAGPALWFLAEPASVAEISAVVVACEEVGAAVLPVGSASLFSAVYPPDSTRPVVMLGLRRLNRILDHQPDDLTVTCEAGVTLVQIEQLLRTRGQTLALDCPRASSSTLGGMVATATAGWRRLAYGTPRDALIGLKAVMAGGVEIKAGGKVVKNVAGYDVCKLFTGSWGSLGVITELTFRVKPVPETRRVVAFPVTDLVTAINTGFELHLARLAPTMILAASHLNGEPAIIVGLEGMTARVEWQTSEITRRIGSVCTTGTPYDLSTEEVQELNDWPAVTAAVSKATVRAACLPADLSNAAERIMAIPAARILADCAVGTFHGAFMSADSGTVTTIQTALPANANYLWTQLDAGDPLETTLPRAQEKRGDTALQGGIKRTLDPYSTFISCRFACE